MAWRGPVFTGQPEVTLAFAIVLGCPPPAQLHQTWLPRIAEALRAGEDPISAAAMRALRSFRWGAPAAQIFLEGLGGLENRRRLTLTAVMLAAPVRDDVGPSRRYTQSGRRLAALHSAGRVGWYYRHRRDDTDRARRYHLPEIAEAVLVMLAAFAKLHSPQIVADFGLLWFPLSFVLAPGFGPADRKWISTIASY